MAVTAGFAADAPGEAHEAALEHDGGEFPEPSLELFSAIRWFTNVPYHTLDYMKRK